MPIFGIYVRFFGSYIFPYPKKTKTPTLKQKKQLGPQPDSSSSERVGDSNRILGGSRQEKGTENAETYTTVYVYIMIDMCALKK